MKRSYIDHFPQKRLGMILPFLFFIFFLTSPGRAEVVDKVVAIVNDEVITYSEVEEEAERINQSLSREAGQAHINRLAEAREIALNGLIDRRLINQRAKSTNTTVTDEELAAALESTRSRMALSPAEFKNKLERSGLTEETFKKQLRDQVLQSKLVSYDVRAKIVVTDEMIRDYYKEHAGGKADKGNVYLLQMGFQWNPEVTDQGKKQEEKTETRKRAERALELVRKGQDFKTVAQKFSDLPSAGDGGDLGILNLDDMAPAMRTAVAQLKPGEISQIIETADSYQFYTVLSTKDDAGSPSSSFDKDKDNIREKLYEEKLKTAYSEWVKKLKESAYIQKL